MSAHRNYWISDAGFNMLKGVPGDPHNPAQLDDARILQALQRSQKAWEDFQEMLPRLLLEERQRLEALVDDNPSLLEPLWKPEMSRDARFHRAMSRIPVRTAGKGVTGRGGSNGMLIPNTSPFTPGK